MTEEYMNQQQACKIMCELIIAEQDAHRLLEFVGALIQGATPKQALETAQNYALALDAWHRNDPSPPAIHSEVLGLISEAREKSMNKDGVLLACQSMCVLIMGKDNAEDASYFLQQFIATLHNDTPAQALAMAMGLNGKWG